MRAISLNVLSEVLKRGFECCLCGDKHINLHHNFIYGGRQLDEAWAILPVCPKCHAQANKKEVREKLDHIMFNQTDIDTLKKYSKVIDLVKRRDELNKKFRSAT